jgi:hypothetical protein
MIREPISIETWPQIYALLAPAMERTGEHVSSLIDLLLANRNQLWVKREGGDPVAAAVSEIEPPSTLCIRLMGGKNIASWIDEAVAAIEANAPGTKVRVEVIPALERVLREHGFRKSKVEMVRG